MVEFPSSCFLWGFLLVCLLLVILPAAETAASCQLVCFICSLLSGADSDGIFSHFGWITGHTPISKCSSHIRAALVSTELAMGHTIVRNRTRGLYILSALASHNRLSTP